MKTSTLSSAPSSPVAPALVSEILALHWAEAAPSVPERMENRSASPQGGVLTPTQVRRLAQWLPSRRSMIKRLWSGKGGRKLAINMFCLDCVGENVSAVRTCTAPCCPLFHFRPFQRKTARGTAV